MLGGGVIEYPLHIGSELFSCLGDKQPSTGFVSHFGLDGGGIQ